jgi:succinate dehydrogenase/fumarate reductase cytochrome b subunit
MIALAILGTVAAAVWSLLAAFGNGMRSSPGKSRGASSVGTAWFGVAVLWLAWWFE